MVNLLRSPDIHSHPFPADNFSEGSVERRIIGSVERLGLDSERSVLVGSAALVLYGVDLPQGDRTMERPDQMRPGDVDLTVDASQFIALMKAGQTPTGIPLHPKEELNPSFHVLRAEPGPHDELPADIITRYTADYGSIQKFDKRFKKFYANHSHVVPGSPSFRIATPTYLRQTLQTLTRDLKRYDDLIALKKAGLK